MKQAELTRELEQIVSGDPWHGSSVTRILEAMDPRLVFIRIGNSHTIAEILLHMIAWTEETQARLAGKPASQPLRGDWPDPAVYTWTELKGLFRLSSEHLLDTIVNLDERSLKEPLIDTRDPALGAGVNKEALIRGLIQHHIYHSGQIALLNNSIIQEK